MAAQNNLHVPDDLLTQAQRLAATEGRTADELAAEALRRYLAREWLKKVSSEGEENRRSLGMETPEEVQDYVDRIASERRAESRGR
jgi:predicted transcriptional regulator